MSESCEGKAAAWPAELARLLSWWKLVFRSAFAHQGGDAKDPREEADEARQRAERKACFLGGEGAGRYGYGGAIDRIRHEEFSRLQDTRYLDHAGSTLYSETQVRKCLSRMERSVVMNPHTSGGREAPFEAARRRTLELCNASREDYVCVFTSGATASIKLVGECFRWSRESEFLYLQDNHNSVVGVREYALEAGATASPVDVSRAEGETEWEITRRARLSRAGGGESRAAEEEAGEEGSNSLLAFPAESNFSGARYDLSLARDVRLSRCKVDGRGMRGDWFVLLDAAKACCTRPPDLADHPADFVALSFYKIFGYPTGLGALLIRRDAAVALRRRYYGGGTVTVSVADEDFFRRRAGEDGWEDGTPSFLAIEALAEGFDQISRLGPSRIEAHASAIASYCARRMGSLRHQNGTRVCEVYGWDGVGGVGSFVVGQGPVVAFNVLRSDGSWVGYREVETLAGAAGIVLRTGCHCNPGACSDHLGITASQAKANFEAGHNCWDDRDVLEGKPTGCVRASFGYMSNWEDADALVCLLEATYAKIGTTGRGAALSMAQGRRGSPPALRGIYVYPVKSCRGFEAESWPVGRAGLHLDRRWAVACAQDGSILTQKRERRLATVETSAHGSRGVALNAPGMETLLLASTPSGEGVPEEDSARASGWFSRFLGRPCELVEAGGGGEGAKKGFSNQGGCLLVCEESVGRLLPAGEREEGVSLRSACLQFRPNLIVAGGEAFQEDGCGLVNLGGGKVVMEKLEDCARCGMVAVDQGTGERTRGGLLRGLARERKGLTFGILVSAATAKGEAVLTVGAPVKFSRGEAGGQRRAAANI